jgi:hypothetical protein
MHLNAVSNPDLAFSERVASHASSMAAPAKSTSQTKIHKHFREYEERSSSVMDQRGWL